MLGANLKLLHVFVFRELCTEKVENSPSRLFFSNLTNLLNLNDTLLQHESVTHHTAHKTKSLGRVFSYREVTSIGHSSLCI